MGIKELVAGMLNIDRCSNQTVWQACPFEVKWEEWHCKDRDCAECTADQILVLSGTTDIECPECGGRKQYLAKWGTQASWERCPSCEGTGLISSKWKVGVVLENGELPKYGNSNYMLLGNYGRQTADHEAEKVKGIQQDMLSAKYKQVVE